ncbi:MAG: glycosyltransferase family 2 protein [Ottowia sp.]|nr:glycosyltransferase family 2 protein [Ottowia sp.]
MTQKKCILIPIYNHKEHIAALVHKLSVYHVPLFIVDDGSDLPTQTILLTIASTYPDIHLFRLEKNQGKGAAVMHGLRAAYLAGFSHALQIDADGQHNTDDVPLFFQYADTHPHAVICGKPIYDASAPKARRYGRNITHFWVWIETLSFAIGDTLCGFRLYPLAATYALIESTSIPTRMDFDVAIAVHLAWLGIPFKNIPTRVIYPVQGLSHFDMLRDNLRISRTHTQLVFGMLWRLPTLLRHRYKANKEKQANKKFSGTVNKHHIHKAIATQTLASLNNDVIHSESYKIEKKPHNKTPTQWAHIAERGHWLGMQILFTCTRLLGERATRWLLIPIVAYFFLTRASARHASQNYLHRIRAIDGVTQANGYGVFQHMLAFAQSGLTKLAAWLGKIKEQAIDFPDCAQFEQLCTSGRGAVLIGSHLGNIEMLRALASHHPHVVINAVVYTEHAQKFNRMLAQANAQFSVNLIEVSRLSPELAIQLKEKIEQGELLVIVGDRTPVSQGRVHSHISTVTFLRHPAPFAQGPFILASLLECPVYLFFCLQEHMRYRIYFEAFAPRICLSRNQRTQQLNHYIQHYAERLEHYCLKAPYQWFNFYDFWQPAHV